MNNLLFCSWDVFRLTEALKKNEVISFREKIIEAFSKLESVEGLTAQEVDNAKYALAAYVDEVVMRSECEEKSRWMSEPLQWEFYGEMIAGENFFKRLETIKNIDVLEVYYCCLMLGFRGLYEMESKTKLHELLKDLRAIIESARDNTEERLETPKKAFPIKAIIVCMAGIIFFTYVGLSISINHQARNSLINIKASEIALKSQVGI